jgi:branched-chain amino acid transport system substrate-binding protein
MNRYAWALAGALAGAMVAALATPAVAQNKYDPGASDTEIKIGGTAPFSGPVSVAGQLVKSVAAYFDMINAQGGINGRKITYLLEDDAFAPAKAVEVTRKLVEKDGVLFMAGSIGTPAQLAVRGYLNEHNIPQLFVTSGNQLFYDPKASPWSLGTNITNRSEGRLIGKYIEETMPGKKVAVLYQNDDLGKEYYVGLQQTLGQKSQLVATATSEVTDPSVDSQMATLQASGADVLGLFTSSKFTAQAIRRAFDTGWKPKIIIPLISAQIDGTLRPAGLDKSIGVVADSVTKDASDPHWANDPGMIALRDFQKTYNPSVTDLSYNASGYNAGYLIAEVIRRAGNDLTRANIMKQAATLDHVHPPLLVPGIDVTTTPDDFRLVHQVQFQVFTGEHWELLGTPVSD